MGRVRLVAQSPDGFIYIGTDDGQLLRLSPPVSQVPKHRGSLRKTHECVDYRERATLEGLANPGVCGKTHDVWTIRECVNYPRICGLPTSVWITVEEGPFSAA